MSSKFLQNREKSEQPGRVCMRVGWHDSGSLRRLIRRFQRLPHRQYVWPESAVPSVKRNACSKRCPATSPRTFPNLHPKRSQCPDSEAELKVILPGSTRPGSGRPDSQTVPHTPPPPRMTHLLTRTAADPSRLGGTAGRRHVEPRSFRLRVEGDSKSEEPVTLGLALRKRSTNRKGEDAGFSSGAGPAPHRTPEAGRP